MTLVSVNDAAPFPPDIRTGQPRLNVMQAPFHAKGDGVTDDANAIQMAYDAAPATGAVVEFPEGRPFAISRYIRVATSNVVTRGPGATIIALGKLTSGFVVGVDKTGAFLKTDNITFDSLTIQGQADGQGSLSPPFAITVAGPPGGAATPYVEGQGCSHIRLQNMRATGFCGGLAATGADDVRIIDPRFDGMLYYAGLAAGGYGILLQSCFRVSVVRPHATATITDRHAIYVSADPDRNFTSSNVCQRVKVTDPDIDWRGVLGGPTGFEAAIVNRSALGFTCTGGHVLGGYGGIDYDGENGNGTDFVVRGTVFDGTFAAAGSRGCINIIRSANAWTLSGVVIEGCTFKPLGTTGNMYGVVLSQCQRVVLRGNRGEITNTIALVGILGGVVDAHFGGNNWVNTAQYNYLIDGAGNSQISFGKDHIDLAGGAVHARWNTYPALPTFHYVRTCSVRANSTAQPVAIDDQHAIIAALASNAIGVDITFAGNVNAPSQFNVRAHGTDGVVFSTYVSAVVGQVATIGVKNQAGTAMPASANNYDISLEVMP